MSDWIALEQLACAPADASRVLRPAQGGQRAVTLPAWQAEVRRQAAWLQTLPHSCVAVWEEDPLRFAAWLWAAWHAGKQVVLPGDTQWATVAALDRLGCLRVGALPDAMQPAGVAELALQALDPERCRLCLFTSGSSGTPQPIDKFLRQCAAEVQTLEQTFGAGLDRAGSEAGAVIQFWGTVSHQHIYGLLFLLLWPLASGRPLGGPRLAYPEDIVAQLGGPSVLVATPAHLRRLDERLAWTGVQLQLRAVFSSGGPLPFEVAQGAAALLGRMPIEVFGSSETGGIAWRQSYSADTPWQPFAAVRWRAVDGCLQVQSPHLSDGAWFATADRVAPAEAGSPRPEEGGPGDSDANGRPASFVLLGRQDRIAKIEENRVSLSAIERQLQADPRVAEAAVAVVPTAIGERVGAVLVLTEVGRQQLAAGRRQLVAALRQGLREAVPAIAWPRRWRFVAALPVNAQGKSTQALLLRQLQEPAPALPPLAPAVTLAAWPTAPAVQWRERAAQRAVAVLDIAPALEVFDGHFPDHPILPGVAQLDWVLTLGHQAFALPPHFGGLQALKFVRPILPGTSLVLELELRPAPASPVRTLAFRLYSHDAAQQVLEHASGRALWSDAEPRM